MAQKSTIYKVELSVSDMDRHYYETHKLTVAKHGLVALTFRSLNSFMRPFVRMPMGFCHLATSACGVCYKNH